MKTYRFLTRLWVHINAENLEEAINKYNSIDLGSLDMGLEEPEEEDTSIEFWEEHSVQTIEEEVDGVFKTVDNKMHVGTPLKAI